MNMIKNLYFVLNATRTRLGTVILGEMIHGIFLSAPTGILLFIIWELFTPEPDSRRIWTKVGILAVMLVIQMWVAAKVTVHTNTAILTMTSKLRMMLGDHMHRLSLGFYKKQDPGDLASVVLQDVSNFEAIFRDQFQNLVGAALGTLILGIFLFVLDRPLAILMMAALPIAFLFMILANKIARKFSLKHVASRNETGSKFIEYVQGVQYLKAFNLTGDRFEALQSAFQNLRKNSIKLEAVIGPVAITSLMIFELFFLLMVWVGLNRIYPQNTASLSIPAFAAYLIVGYRLYAPLQLLMVSYAHLNYMNISLERIRQLLQTPLQDAGNDLIPEKFDIVFNKVGFAYVDQKVLDKISLTIPENKLTALVGPSGSGKTTITNLIARFWDVQEGHITIGGIDLRQMSPRTVYSLISEVFQDVYLFDDTIYNNIRIGDLKATEDQILETAQKARVTEFLDDLEHGIQTMVGEGGSKLSGGQKQRISIARAMLKNAPIVLLDEATAALDPENEIYIQQAIQALVREKTVVVIAHKLQTVRNADNIIVLKDKAIAEAGTHEVLLEQNGLYYRYWQTQQSGRSWKIGAR